MPEKGAKTVNEGVCALHVNTDGGRVRFVTDSPYVAVCAKMPHIPLTGSAGFDLCVEDKYSKTFVPPFDIEDGFESVIDFATSEKREITINFLL